MDKALKIIGIIVVAWIALSLVGWIFNVLFSGLFWAALVAGGVYLVVASGKKRQQVGSRR